MMVSRYKWILAALGFFSLLIILKLGKTTLIDAKNWNELANSSIRDSVVTYPDRGSILADDGSILAANVILYSPQIDLKAGPFNADSLLSEAKLNELCDTVCKLNPAESKEKLKNRIINQVEQFKKIKAHNNRVEKIDKNKRTAEDTIINYGRLRKLPLVKDCFYPELKKILACKFFKNRGGRGTLDYNSKVVRKRPYGNMASQCIGATSKEMINYKSVFHGVTGLEKALDSLLFGQKGIGSTVQMTTRLRTWEKVKSIDGYDVKTTINVQLQDIVETELTKMCFETEAEWGTAIFMETNTGDIKAISNLQRDTTRNGQVYYREGLNRAVMGFEPGSVIKPISMLIALEDNIVYPNEYITTGARFPYAHGNPISDSHAYPGLTAKDIITASSNIGMAKIVIKGFEKNPADFIKRFEEIGMFDPMNLGIYGERIPYFPKLGNRNWDRIDMTRISFGYSTRIPPIYTLAFYNAIANGGKLIKPRLVKELLHDGLTDTIFETSYIRERICREEVAAALRDALKNVVWDQKGTGKALRNNFVSISGKTGTAYTLVKGKYDHTKKRLAFCGFFPSDDPKYSCIVLMNKANRGAARSSGMVILNVALKMYSRGMLGKGKDFRDEPENNPCRPTVYNMTAEELSNVKSSYNINGITKLQHQQNTSGVPSVIGMGLRNAVRTLENAGLNVTSFEGKGYVYSQSLKPGTDYKKGDKITLSLK